MGSSGGGVPSLGGQGFFPNSPQLNPGGLMPFDMMKWANSGGTQVVPMELGGIFGSPMQPAAPQQRVQPMGARSSGVPYGQMGFGETLGALTGRNRDMMMEANRAARGGRYSGGGPGGAR